MAGLQTRLRLDKRTLREFERRLRKGLDEAEEAMAQTADVVEAKMVEITPELTGFLAGSTVVRTVKRARAVIASINFGASYASEVHELPPDARGPRTREKRGNEFGPAGPKFAERVLRGFPLAAEVGKRLRRALRG